MWTLAVDHRKAATQAVAALPPGETLRAAETFETASQHAVGRGPGSPVPKLHAQRRRTITAWRCCSALVAPLPAAKSWWITW